MMSLLAVFLFIIGVLHRTDATATCVWTWTDPAAGTSAGTLTRSIGAPASFTITGSDALVASSTVTVKSDTDVLTLQTHALATASAAATFTATSNAGNMEFAFTAGSPNTYVVSFPSSTGIPVEQNAKVITIEGTGCTDATKTSSGITLSVISCNLAAYGDLATAANQDACNYNCQKEFTCTADDTAKFTSTCQADATWNLKYAACPSASAGVKEVAVLALVMLCSALSAAHLM